MKSSDYWIWRLIWIFVTPSALWKRNNLNKLLLFRDNAAQRFVSERNGPQLQQLPGLWPGHSTVWMFCFLLDRGIFQPKKYSKEAAKPSDSWISSDLWLEIAFSDGFRYRGFWELRLCCCTLTFRILHFRMLTFQNVKFLFLVFLMI